MEETRYKISKEDAERIVKECYSIADFCRAVGWLPRGDNYKIFHKYVLLYNLDTSHFTGLRANLNNRNNIGKSIEEICLNRPVSTKSSVLRDRLIKEGLKLNECEKCHISLWQGNPISLLLHHIDGNHFNNEISNLLILCPNCHSLTDTYCGKKNKLEEKQYFCPDCGSPISRGSKRCVKCAHKAERKFEWPSLEQIIQDIKDYKTYEGIGRKYNVSGRTIKEFCINEYNINLKDYI